MGRLAWPLWSQRAAAPAAAATSMARQPSTRWETNQPFTCNGNVLNRGLITNLPPGACVEAPCLADAMGVQPTVDGALPPQIAALNRTNINVQELAVYGGVRGNREAVYHAVMLDPLTSAICTLDEIRRMTDDLFAAEEAWLPQFHPGSD